MESLLVSIFVILMTALIIDTVLREEDVRRWREATAEMRARLGNVSVGDATLTANRWFLGFFDAVYGARFFSRKRLIRSCISSLIALFVIVLAIGWERTVFGLDDIKLWGLITFILFCNLAGDFLSLQETRWVMARSQGSQLLGLSFWVVIDLIATTVIFVVGIFLLVTGVGIFLVGERSVADLLVDQIRKLEHDLTDMDGLLPFWLSTYFTSAIWFVFIGVVLIIRLLKRLSPAVTLVLRAVGESERPAQATAGFACAALFVGYGGVYLVTTAWAWIG